MFKGVKLHFTTRDLLLLYIIVCNFFFPVGTLAGGAPALFTHKQDSRYRKDRSTDTDSQFYISFHVLLF